MNETSTIPAPEAAQRLRLSSRITGIIFWGAVLTGILVVAVLIKLSESDFQARQDYQTVLLLRAIENTIVPQHDPGMLAGKEDALRQTIEAFSENDHLAGAEIRIGDESIHLGDTPKGALAKTIQSNHIVNQSDLSKLEVTAYFDNTTQNIYGARKNLIVFLGVISFAFGLIINRVLKKMLTNPIDQMIGTAAAYAGGDKTVRFDESKDDEFGFMSRFINMALNSSETMHQQLEASVHEQRDAKERAEQALGELERAQDRLVQSEKLASLGQLTAGIAHEIKNPLNFINNFSETSVELLDELKQSITPLIEKIDSSAREEVNALLEDLSSDLGTIAKHGKRADSIVKNMLMHSRDGGVERLPTDINALVSEAVGLAYHGERAVDGDFQVELVTDLDDDLRHIMVVPQDVSRVLINLLSNAFYATKKRKEKSGANGYAPIVSVSTLAKDDGVEIRIHDNGIGISKEDQQNLFSPFFTTKPTGQGTGLGLSISHDIITKQHDGIIGVNSEEGDHTEFIIWFPSFTADGKKFENAGTQARAQGG